MIVVGNTIISDDIADHFFVCDLQKCKGACCIEGDAGAPLEEEELAVIENNFSKIKPYLNQAGAKAIQEQGMYVVDESGDYTTPTINNRECAYAIYDKGILKCAIEKAYNEGKIDFKKPISCHLYPIRISKYDKYDALNYDRWHICNPACHNGRSLGVPIYKFLKDSLTRKYGEEWYRELVVKIEEK